MDYRPCGIAGHRGRPFSADGLFDGDCYECEASQAIADDLVEAGRPWSEVKDMTWAELNAALREV